MVYSPTNQLAISQVAEVLFMIKKNFCRLLRELTNRELVCRQIVQ